MLFNNTQKTDRCTPRQRASPGEVYVWQAYVSLGTSMALSLGAGQITLLLFHHSYSSCVWKCVNHEEKNQYSATASFAELCALNSLRRIIPKAVTWKSIGNNLEIQRSCWQWVLRGTCEERGRREPLHEVDWSWTVRWVNIYKCVVDVKVTGLTGSELMIKYCLYLQ